MLGMAKPIWSMERIAAEFASLTAEGSGPGAVVTGACTNAVVAIGSARGQSR